MNLKDLEIELNQTILNFCQRNSCKIHNFYINCEETLDGKANFVGRNISLKYYLIDLQPKAEGPILRVED